MGAIYSDQIIEEVRSRTSLVELVGERVPVRQSGKNYQACCPFHSEKTPSFHINEDDGLYYCFGCGKKGNTYTFVMETKSLTFPEAVRFLAQRAGVNLPVQTDHDHKNNDPLRNKSLLRRIVLEVCLIYEESLESNKGQSKKFLEERRISDYTAKRFRMGYAEGGRNGENLAEGVFERIRPSVKCSLKDVTESLTSLGLLRKRTSGNIMELFWDRVIFPITNSDSTPLAFGGRIIKATENAPKYINSPESPVFEKRKTFFGLGQGFMPAQKEKHVYLMEGYLDVISFSQIGIHNSLAVCGTALTLDHVKVLKRFVNKATLIFDGDGAGRAAAAKAFPAFLDSGIEVVPVILTEEEDPDSLTYGRTEDEIRKILQERATSLLKLHLEVIGGSLRGLERGIGVPLDSLNAAEAGKVAEELSRSLVSITNPVELEYRLREASGYLGVSEAALSHLVKDQKKNGVKVKQDFNYEVVKENHNSEEQKDEAQGALKSVLSHSRRMSILRRQLLVSLIVEPSILCSSSVRSQVALLGVTDSNISLLVKRLIVADKSKELSEEIKVIPGVARILTTSEEEKEEILARYNGILTECGLKEEGLLEEALNQLYLGKVVLSDPTNLKKAQEKLIEDFSHVVERINATDELDLLRKRETQEANVESRLSLAQEKLLRKRALSKGYNN